MLSMLTLQTPQKQERQVTPKKTPEKRTEDDEYAGSTDVDEPGQSQTTLIESPTVEKCIWTSNVSSKIQSTSAFPLQWLHTFLYFFAYYRISLSLKRNDLFLLTCGDKSLELCVFNRRIAIVNLRQAGRQGVMIGDEVGSQHVEKVK